MIITITNQKGGVGKTTLSINLSCALALLGYRVLIIDMDPQGNATDGLGIEADQCERTVYDVLINETSFNDVILNHPIENLFVAPANMSLFGAEAELSTEINRPFKLRKALKPHHHKYDFIIIDCPPNLGMLTVNAILASSDLIAPIEPNSYALKGMSVLMNTIIKIQHDLEHYINFLGVAVNMFEEQNELHQSIAERIIEFFPARKVFQTKITRNGLIAEAEIQGQSIVQYRPHSEPSILFINLAREIVATRNERKELARQKAAR